MRGWWCVRYGDALAWVGRVSCTLVRASALQDGCGVCSMPTTSLGLSIVSGGEVERAGGGLRFAPDENSCPSGSNQWEISGAMTYPGQPDIKFEFQPITPLF